MANEFTFKLDDAWLRHAIRRSPTTFARHMRKGMVEIFGSSKNPRSFPGWLKRILPERYKFVPKAMRKSVNRSNDINSLRGVMKPKSRLIYGLQFGGTIRAKRGKYLAIPIKKSVGRTGLVIRNGRFRRRPRDFTDLVPIKTKSGDLVLAKRRSVKNRKRAKRLIDAYFYLTPSVHLRKRISLDRDWLRYAPRAARILEEHMGNGLKEFARGR